MTTNSLDDRYCRYCGLKLEQEEIKYRFNMYTGAPINLLKLKCPLYRWYNRLLHDKYNRI